MDQPRTLPLCFKENGTGSAILFIHGTGGTADAWGTSVDELAEDHHIITYDRRGYGRSARPAPTDLHQHTQDAATLLHHLGVPQATIVGHSLGAVIGVDLALTQPSRVATLVLIEPPWLVRLRPSRGLLQLLLHVQLLRLSGRRERAVERFLTWVYTDAHGVSAYDRVPGVARAVTADTEAVLADIDSGPRVYFTAAQLATIRCPVTFVLGERTAAYIGRAVHTAMAAIPQARLVVAPEVGHELHVAASATITAAVRAAAGRATYASPVP